MNVLILTMYFPPEIGAAQTRLSSLGRELMRRGHQVEVVTATPHHLRGAVYEGYRNALYQRDAFEGMTVHRTWVYPATGTGFKRLANYFSFTASSLLGLLRARRPDVVFVESPPLFLSVPGWFAAKLRGAKLVFNVADLWPDAAKELGVIGEGAAYRVASGLERWTYRRAYIVNAVTQGIEEALRGRKGVPSSKVRALPNGVDCETFSPRPPDEALARELQLDGRPMFLYAGTHGIAHGLHHLLTAAEIVGERATIVFVGGGPAKPALIETAKARGLRNVRFIDPVPVTEMPRYLSLATGALCPLIESSIMEQVRPAKMFPALASGVPLIYSGRGEGARIIAESHSGIVLEPERPELIAQAMLDLIDGPAERAAMALNAREVAVSRFAWSSIVDSWLASLPQGVTA